MASLSYLTLFCILIIFFPFSTTAQPGPNITLGSSLTVNGDTAIPWAISSSGDYAFGFVPLESDRTQFLLAIWYAKLTNDPTVVWYANNKTVEEGSTVLLNSSRLSLTDGTGQEIWGTDPGGDVSYGALLDVGNFVLISKGAASSDRLWQTFDHPTDTFLPTQVMIVNGMLSSRYSDSVYTRGRFQFRVISDGNVVLNTVGLPKDFAYDAYWWSNTSTSTNTTVIFDESVGVQVIATTSSTPVNIMSGVSSKNVYQRATLDPDGVLRLYVRPKPNVDNTSYPGDSWTVAGSVPGNICRATAFKLGSGICGFNAICQIINTRPQCRCPLLYKPLDPGDLNVGCIPNFVEHRCDRDESSLFDLLPLNSTDFPAGEDYEWLQPMNEDECRASCLQDCRCMVAISTSSTCRKKKTPLSNGMFDPIATTAKALLKVRRDNASNNNQTYLQPYARRSRTPVTIWGVIGGLLFINSILVCAVTILIFFNPLRKHRPDIIPRSVLVGQNLHAFSYKSMEEATNKFSKEVGSGSFGKVYKGRLPLAEGEILIAVKKLDRVPEQGEKEFRAEMSSIGRTHHKNLVRLIGFCDEEQHRLLVYEFMSNGSLADYIFSNDRPRWERRVQIIYGIARGLTYLHDECDKRIIHCDIKPQNILLDEGLNAKISDFGLAKLLVVDQTKTATGIRGTKGYVAPEWFKNRAISAKVDVYSFGVVLLEVLSCRKNVDHILTEESMILVYRVYDYYMEGKLSELVEHDEEAISDMNTLERLVRVGIWCIQEEPSIRPSMKKVMQMLEGTVEISEPPDPSSFTTSF